MDKVVRGTRGTKSMCETCVFATIIRGSADSQEFVKCGEINKEIPFRVVECNSYTNKASTGLYEMRQIAWHVDVTKKSGTKVGFTSPEQRREKGEEDLGI